MISTSTPAEQRTVLHNISWETFEALLTETGEDRGSRFAYECGTLEIMTPLFEHENGDTPTLTACGGVGF